MNDSNASGKILVTGVPGIGKTTLIKRVAERVRDLRPVGFYTQDMRERGVRVGFEIAPLDGSSRWTLAHVDIQSPYRVGKYGVDIGELDRFLAGLDLSGEPVRPVIIDEIGKMECFSERFRGVVRELLGSSRPVLGTVARRGGGLIAEVKNYPEIRLLEVTGGNRERLVDEIAESLRRAREER